MTLNFTKKTQAKNQDGTLKTDKFNNPIWTDTTVTVDDCLVAPITQPDNAREQQAMEQQRIQVRVHLPKADDSDIADSTFTYSGVEFKVDADPVVFMSENTPTRWNRFFRAEVIVNE